MRQDADTGNLAYWTARRTLTAVPPLSVAASDRRVVQPSVMMTGVVSAEQAVLEANQRFYQALSEMDADAMEQIWLHEPWVRCIHPGWQLLSSWDDVRESWRQIFRSTGSHQVEASEVKVRLFGELAWALCLERITSRPDSGNPISLAQGTNLFLRTPSGWRMVLHHASVVPFEMPPETSTTVH